MEKTLVILKPSCIERALIGKITARFERKGLSLIGLKMMKLDDRTLTEHYAHLSNQPFFRRILNSMEVCPVVIQCWEGKEAIKVVRNLVGITNGRDAAPGTIRGDYSMSSQENIVHASDSLESAELEIRRFFNDNEIFQYESHLITSLYANDEI